MKQGIKESLSSETSEATRLEGQSEHQIILRDQGPARGKGESKGQSEHQVVSETENHRAANQRHRLSSKTEEQREARLEAMRTNWKV